MADKKRVHHFNTNEDGRTPVSYVFSFILSLALVFGSALLLLKVGCFTENVFLRLIDRNYYVYTLHDIEESSVDYTLPTGIDISVIDQVFTEEDVRAAVKGYISAAFRQNDDYQPDVSVPSEKLTANVRKFYEDHNVTVTAETEDIIDTYVEEIMDVFRFTTRMPGLDLIMEGKHYFERFFGIAMVIVLILSIFLVFMCVKLHRYAHRGLRYVVYAFIATAIMLFAFPCFLYVSKTYTQISLRPQYFYHFVVTYLQKLLSLFFIGAAFWLLLSFLLMALISVMRKNVRHRSHHSH